MNDKVTLKQACSLKQAGYLFPDSEYLYIEDIKARAKLEDFNLKNGNPIRELEPVLRCVFVDEILCEDCKPFVYDAPHMGELFELLPEASSILKNNGKYRVSFYGHYTPSFSTPIEAIVHFLIEDKVK